jgi:hypothetical protein
MRRSPESRVERVVRATRSPRSIRGGAAVTLDDATLVAMALEPDFSDDEIEMFIAFCNGEIPAGVSPATRKSRAAVVQEFIPDEIEAFLAFMMLAA